MAVTYQKHFSEERQRTEFWINDFDYIDGIDYLARLFCEKWGMTAEPKWDGIWMSTIKLHLGNETYELMWHEDIGNIVYPCNASSDSVSRLEAYLKTVLSELNRRIGSEMEVTE